MSRVRTIILTTLLAASLGTSAVSQTQATNLEHPDNLKVTHRLGCIALEKVRNSYTPADISRAVTKCAERGKFEQAIQLFFVYSVYGYYDQERMVDTSAGNAIGALNLKTFRTLSAGQREGMAHAAQEFQDASGALFKGTCDLVEKLGPPSYEPIYMAAHGLKSFKIVGEKVEYLTPSELSELVKDVDAERLWNESLHEINNCPR